ncbi:tellurite resistance/C4-dicarboxylate transporter family protein [Virgibacillus soli]|uniref:Tellurite resistance/C4-dicarboxylate transporter family protein n=1 Tax=Paracerasibacillus soli TaxID=480284 RepID=A0ABU5CTK0_9BACI|nr:tellurite resistance/C4-dicarboxylate transporter family protein [Virgibacillus soli]MDY0409702.1 tellurite resistance/C4-dicarboxylate transporter family protein [Virgibacillus soli]
MIPINFLKQQAENLFPGYFALVMATGILSIGSHLLGMEPIAILLLFVNIVAYTSLWILTFIRIFYYYPKVRRDLTSHTLGPGFFTMVAGTSVFGSQLIMITGHYLLSVFLWAIAIVLWIIIMYTFFTAVTIRTNKPSIAEGINGAWLIATVATQSISILGTLLSSYVGVGRDVMLFVTLCMYFLGCMLYLNIITLIFYRFTFVELKFDALTPPYWINMGAVAITTLAGSTLILHHENWSLLKEITPFLKGFTLFFWITGTWWIPLLFILTIWRYVYHHFPITYDPQLWGMVFPLGMYTASTFQLSHALDVPFLIVIPKVMFYIAFTAWILVLCGLIHHIYLHIIRFNKG